MILVVDTSVAVKWFVKENGHVAALRLLALNFDIVAPDLMFAEFANVLWKKLRRGEVTPSQAKDACDSLPGYFDEILATAPLMYEAIQLAQIDYPVYDCLYIACATKQQNAKLVTVDQRLVRKLAELKLSDFAVSLDQASQLVSDPNVGSDLSRQTSEPSGD